MLGPDPYEEAATLPAAPALTGITSGTDSGSGETAAAVPSSSSVATASLRLQTSVASLSVAPSQDSSAETTAAPTALVAPATATPVATPNKIALENLKQGNPISEWGLEGDGGGTIQGFATEISTNIGQTVDFKIATDSTHYRIDIYRMGYYGGLGARKVDSIEQQLTTAQIQPHPIVDMSLGLIDCGNWSVSASWQIPTDAVSGVYFAKLVREDGTEDASIIPFVVRDDASTSNIVFQTSDTTWQAYNAWGGASLYYGEVPVDPANMIGYLPPNCSCGLQAIGRASAVSYNRPIITNTSPVGGSHDYIFGVESSAISWLEQNGYDVSYISGVDATRSGALLLNHDAYLSVGHDEYWSAEQRANVEAARDAGVNLAFWSGNECYWKVRWESSIDGSGQAYRTMVCYKETWGTSTDPSNVGTGTWRDPRYADPGQEPENSLTGTMFQVDSYRQDTISIPYDYSQLRFWRNTDVSQTKEGDTYNLVQNLLGYEWDSDVENGFRPDGLVNLSLSSISVDTYLRDYGATIGSAVATHSLTMYRAASGALVFGAGTVFWSWGLSDNHQGPTTSTDRNVQQAMVNMFADMGIQPTTLDASLILATQSTDTLKPTSSVTSPIVGASFLEGQHVTITGTAQDFGGGIVAGVEISTDGGQHWFKATGRENWSYNWVVQASGTYTIMSRAVDDSVNMETPSVGKQVTVTLPGTQGLWTLADKPAVETAIDRDSVELGLRFQTTTAGFVEGIRFYKGFYNIGDHAVSLWRADGTLLATGVSVGESLSGWQTVMFSSPIQIAAGTTYVASYHSNGFYSVTGNYFSDPYGSGALKAVDGGGVFAYGTTAGTFPGQSPGTGTNYWVDVVFDAGPNSAPVATDDTGLVITSNDTVVISIASLVGNDTDPNADALTISAVGNAVNGTVTLNKQNRTVIFTPTNNYSGPASFTYTLSDGRGGTDQGSVSLTVNPGPTGETLFTSSEGPAGGSFNDGQPMELGMKFVASSSGLITGIRYYKASGDTGPHTGSLWTADGTLVATVSFADSGSVNGWQTATFANAVHIAAGTTYVASYSTTGSYVATANYFTSAHTNGALTALAGSNGVYTVGSSAFPTASYQSTNYWVDVVYNKSTGNAAPVAANDNGYTTYSNTALSIAAASLLANDTDADGDPLSITGVNGAVNGTVTFNSQTKSVTFTPTAGYTGAASFSYSISDGLGGTASATVSLTVGTPPGGGTTSSLFTPADTSGVAAANDANSVELGVKFIASASGQITGLAYFRSAQDAGTHVGSLWTASGQLLAQATFINETAGGWQTVSFTQPINVTAGTTYVASYHSNGFYSATANYFTTDHTSGALTAPASSVSGGNGVYAYGTGSLFPTASYNATNYWVDVLYKQGSQNAVPVAANDSGFTTNTGTPITIQASALLSNDTDADSDPLAITGVSGAVNGSVVWNAQSQTVTFTPMAGYSGPASFSYAISDGKGGTASAQVALTVNSGAAGPEQNLFASNATPSVVSVNDNQQVNLGMKFQADAAGWITAIRFYKGADNTGPHNGYLWTASGTLLGSVTFNNETASGWQTAQLSQQIAIQADTTYVVSYSTNGNYSATGNYFASDVTNGDLKAPSGNNGVYAYGSGGLFPTASYNSTNYYVDVAFKPQLAA
ncbi:oxidoreductase domain-containing protein (plasmid) [Rhizobium phaseoli]|uniref:Oxidoreductase domain-containing protein n=1 Tax=Rhizobium phaseoli TaxID=396 RepID=A0ABM6CJL2_9HYPH|nr:oxidoreductase domain-containing protein [Rhizobium phaseoli]ANL95017.1 oxidoreductase domain-containing protein [Rhizobium phaseoli]